MPFDLWLTFLGAAILLALAPGPDNLFVTLQSAMHGVRAGLFVTLGLCCGVLFHTTIATIGVGALIAGSPLLLTALKTAGAAYLLWLAYSAWRSPVSEERDPSSAPQTVRLSDFQLWRRGILMNVSNPKVLLFFLAFFPSFIRPGTEEHAAILQMAVMGATFLIVTLTVFSLFAWCAGKLADAVRTPRVQIFFNRLSAVVFAGLAVSTLLVTV